MFATCSTIRAQTQPEEYLGLPGDNLNLYAVMQLFQESETLETFENKLNEENSRINNLDLNGDNYVDYINVIDYPDGDVHNIVLQVAVNSRETQDVAVFTVQKFNNGQVQIQLIGDEELYGKDYIIEPIYDEQIAGQTPNPGYTGNNITVVRTTTYEVAAWPVIRFIYLPNYVVWRSRWHWGYYPPIWRPWRPYYWHYYYGYHYNWYNSYYRHYRRWNHYRYNRWNDFYYTGKRAHSPYVSFRIKEGNYKSTYSRPDQRRNGEALYSRSHPDQGTRRTNNSSVSTSARRSAPQSDQNRQSKGSVSGASTTRRTNTSVSNKSVANPSSVQNAGTTRRSTSTVSTKPVTSQSKGQNAGSARRTTSVVTSKQASKTPASRNAGSARASRQSKPVATSSKVQRSSKSSKSGTTSKSSAKRTNSRSTGSTRRK